MWSIEVELSISESEETLPSETDSEAKDISVMSSVSKPAASASADACAESY